MRNNLCAAAGAVVLAAGVLSAMPQAKASIPPVIAVTIAGRPIDAEGEYARTRHGVVSVDLVDFARALGGTLIYRTPNGAEVALNNKHLVFTTGNKTALLDSVPIVLSAAPFVIGTRYYVPLRSLALTAGFVVHYDKANAQISLGLPVVAVSPTPLASQLVLAAAGSVASDGLHVTATTANLTGAPLAVAFPTTARVAFVAIRNGRTLWDSIDGTRALESKKSLMFTANEAKSFAGFWPGFLTAGPGPITIRTELLSTPPIFAPNFVVAGIPLPSPSPHVQSSASPSPINSSVPTTSTMPVNTVTPKASAIPGSSAMPKASAIPESSAMPKASAIPESSAMPKASAMPDASAMPKASAMPDSSAMPESSSMPDVNVMPQASATSHMNPAPDPSGTPAVYHDHKF